MVLKEKNREASFKTWDEYKDLTKAEIAELWDVVLPKEDLYFYVWLQKNASEQLQEASKYCKAKDILLKGDILILKIGRAHVRTPVTSASRMPSSACKK